jgi:septal ring factor EnvC (AmiA/AmiB activator)
VKWIGHLSTIILLQMIFLGIYLKVVDRFPSHELGLAWQAIFADPLAKAEGDKLAEAPPPPEIPSYEDLLKERLLASPEIARKIEELQAVRRAVAEDQKKLELARTELRNAKDQLENKTTTAVDQAREEGEKKLLELVSVMKPKQAKEYLLADPMEDRILRMLIAMDPAAAEKIFREFKQPADQRTLNSWLDRLGQGDPEAKRLRALLEEVQKQPVS